MEVKDQICISTKLGGGYLILVHCHLSTEKTSQQSSATFGDVLEQIRQRNCIIGCARHQRHRTPVRRPWEASAEMHYE